MDNDRRQPPPVSPAQLRHTMAGFPTGIAFVAAVVERRPVGMLANSLVSVSLDPPLVALSFDATSTTWPTLKQATRWGISVLGERHTDEVALLRRPTADRFRGIEPVATPSGALTIPNALATMTVEVERSAEVGDHTLVLLQVLDLHRDTDQAPLVFYSSGMERLAAR